MITQRFTAKSTHECMNLIKDQFGDNALIVSTNPCDEGVEIVVSVEAPVNNSNIQNEKAIFAAEKIIKDEIQNGIVNNINEENLSVNFKMQEIEAENQEKAILNSTHFLNEELNSIVQSNNSLLKEIDGLRNFKSEIKSEMNVLKDLLQDQLSTIVWGRLKENKPICSSIRKVLSSAGFSTNIIKSILEDLPKDLASNNFLSFLHNKLSSLIKVKTNQDLAKASRKVFLGSSGVGKTLSLIKYASKYVTKFGSDKVVIFSLADDIGANEKLKVFCKILNISFRFISSEYELQQAIYAYRNIDLMLLDVPSNIPSELLESTYCLSDNGFEYSIVLAANTQYDSLIKQINNYKTMNLNTVIITKLDESSTLGEVLSAVIENALNIEYVSNGTRVPDDLILSNPKDLINQAIVLSHTESSNIDKNELGTLISQLETDRI